jgi:hypothetical protein
MAVVDIVDGEQRTAGEQELRGERLEAQRLQGDAKRRFRPSGEERGNQEKQQGGAEGARKERARATDRDGVLGNRHGKGRV